MLRFGYLLLFITALLQAETPFLKRADAPLASGQHFMLSYARSGTNLTSCYLQYLTGKPIKFLFDDDVFLSENRLDLPIDHSKPILYRTHYSQDLTKIDKQSNKLLYILRNYKEAILRHNHKQIASPEAFRELFKKNKAIVTDYMHGLKIYDAWDPSMRLLIHYEDLLTDPVHTMAQVLAFFEEPIPAHLSVELLKEVSARALSSYGKQHGSHSKGEDLFYHTRNIPLDLLKEIDAAVEKIYPALWNQYLKRYLN
jgi:Sulfotransferase domain